VAWYVYPFRAAPTKAVTFFTAMVPRLSGNPSPRRSKRTETPAGGEGRAEPSGGRSSTPGRL